MASPEVDRLSREVAELGDKVQNLQLTVEGFAVLETRVEALEKSNQALNQRVAHMDKVIMAIQSDVQKLGKQFTQMSHEHTMKLDLIMTKQNELLSLLQPKVTVG